jgi:acetyl esterase/lipase
MKKNFLLLLAVLTASLKANAATEKWPSLVTGRELNLTISEPAKNHGTSALPVIIYLRNLAAPRVGTESDDAILRDFRAANYLVATLDYAHATNARVPFINRDLGKLRDDFRAKKILAQFQCDEAHIYLVPEGCRLRRDILYYADTNRPLSLDLIYPSQPKQPVGALLEFSCDNQNRFGNTSLSICSDTLLDAAATEGFAVAMADHPVAPPYKGLDAMPDCAFRIKAAVRTLRAEGAKLGLNGNIVPVGFSRGSGMALMLVTTQRQPEFDHHGAHPDTSSDVQGAVVMSGRFTYLDLLADDHMIPRYAKVWGARTNHLATWRLHGALDYLTHATQPLFLTINCSEAPDALHQMNVLRHRLDEFHSPAEFLLDTEPRGHKVTLDPQILEAMNRYLRARLHL